MSLNKISPSNLISSEEEELKKSLENIEDRETLKKGYYLGVLENYRKRPPWTMQAISRDGWQNFFDVKHTLDGIEFELKEEENKGSILIKCNFEVEGASYDYTELLSFGGGYKGDTEEKKETVAGGKHEETRIIALNMLRDYEFTKIVYGSKDWELEFYFDAPPKIVTGKRQKGLKGLYVKLKDKKEDPRSYAFIVYKHEICHKQGTDESAAFSYAQDALSLDGLNI